MPHHRRTIEVVASYPYEETYVGMIPDGIVVGGNGKLWMQGNMVGESACAELQSEKSLQHGNSISLSSARCIADSCSRIPDSLPNSDANALLYLPGSGNVQPLFKYLRMIVLTAAPLQPNNSMAECILRPGADGVVDLVFDVPKHAQIDRKRSIPNPSSRLNAKRR